MFFSYFLSILPCFRMGAANPVTSSLARIFISKIREKTSPMFFLLFLEHLFFFQDGRSQSCCKIACTYFYRTVIKQFIFTDKNSLRN